MTLTYEALKHWPNGLGMLVINSRISEAAAGARAYWTVRTEAEARGLGFSHRAAERVTDEHQALLVPVWGIDGSRGWQMRPTRAGRPSRAGKAAPKYETPTGQRNMLDHNPLMYADVMDSDRLPELWVTEGARKVDALASAGVPCLGLTGVWNWRGKEHPGDEKEFAEPLPAWDLVPLKGRPVVIAFDSDASSNEMVAKAREALALFLTVRGASVTYAQVPAAADGGKQGVDDYLAASALDGVRGPDALRALPRVLPGPKGEGFAAEEVEAAEKRERVRKWLKERRERGEKVNGRDLVLRMMDKLRKYTVMPDPQGAEGKGHAYLAAALWALHTHVVMAFDSSPRLCFLAPEKQSGKTRCLETLEPMVRRPDRFFNASEAVMFRTIEDGYGTHRHVTMLIDETDTIFPQGQGAKADPAKESLRGIINAGHRKGSTVKRVEAEGKKMTLKEFPVYAPMALAGIGVLPETVMDRAVVVRMRRRRRDERVSPLRFRDLETEFSELRRDIEDWALAREAELDGYYPGMPEGVEDRPADVWEPLIAVGDRTGWGREAREACLAFLRAEEQMGSTESEGEQLLRSVRLLFAKWGAPEFATTAALETALQTDPDLDGRWGPWCNAKWLSVQLGQYGAKPRQRKVDGLNVRGYYMADFRDAWTRYLGDEHREAGVAGVPGEGDEAASGEGGPGPETQIKSTSVHPPHPPRGASEEEEKKRDAVPAGAGTDWGNVVRLFERGA